MLSNTEFRLDSSNFEIERDGRTLLPVHQVNQKDSAKPWSGLPSAGTVCTARRVVGYISFLCALCAVRCHRWPPQLRFSLPAASVEQG